jgi:2-(1,2-epoxy-1,2-dihydrophenyl)acetyl-CoA isomerase
MSPEEGAPAVEPVLQVERDGHVAVVTLNRPDKLNALNRELTSTLYTTLDELEAAFPDVRAIVLTGAGRGFCAGADVTSMAGNIDAMGRKPADRRQTIVYLAAALRAVPQPIVAAINGVAAGAGLSLALASDVRIASTASRFAAIFVKRALVPDTGACYMLPRTVGPGVAAEMALTGRVYDAEWAQRVGLVSPLVEPEELMATAMQVAQEIAANPPIAVRTIKQVMQGFTEDLTEVATIEADANRSFADSNDRREAIQSFVEKRAPVYRGD